MKTERTASVKTLIKEAELATAPNDFVYRFYFDRSKLAKDAVLCWGMAMASANTVPGIREHWMDAALSRSRQSRQDAAAPTADRDPITSDSS